MTNLDHFRPFQTGTFSKMRGNFKILAKALFTTHQFASFVKKKKNTQFFQIGAFDNNLLKIGLHPQFM